jgi:magnesium transporter
MTRDLRKIDESQLPAILVRQSTILVNLLHFRVLITYEDVLVLHVFKPTQGETSHISAFMYELQGKLQLENHHHVNLPYELRALETILLMVMSELDIESQDLQKPARQVLQELDHGVSLEKLKKLADVSRQLSAFQQKVKLVREALRTVLEADDDMAAMYLTEKALGKPRAEANHEEVELLLENYYECCGEIMEKADHLLSDVQITHDRLVMRLPIYPSY